MKQDIINELNKDIEIKKELLKAWQQVKFVTKKDGTPFKSIQKNIIGASYQQKHHFDRCYEKELYVCINTKYGYKSDGFNCYKPVDRLTDKQKAKTQNYQEKIPYLQQQYLFDIEDIKEGIKKRINYLENNIKEKERVLQVISSAYDNFYNNYKKAIEQLQKDISNEHVRYVRYNIKEDVLKSIYEY